MNEFFAANNQSFVILAVAVLICLVAAVFIRRLYLNSLSATVDCPEYLMDCKYWHWKDGTGIGINPAGRKLNLIDGMKTSTYSFDNVRRWERNWIDGRFVSTEFSKNKRTLEISIEVRDIMFPRWRVAFASPYELARWNEILQQCINEDAI